jgi:hypothetical protein
MTVPLLFFKADDARGSRRCTTAPSGRSMRFNLRSAKNASLRPSGDQNTDVAPSVPGTGRASRWATARSQTRVRPVSGAAGSATNASCDPSGDNAKNVRPGWRSKKLPSGGGTAKRTGEGDTDGPERGEPNMANAIATLVAVARIAAIAATRLLSERGATSAVSVSCSSAIRASPISRSRSFGSLVRQQRRRRTRFGGVPARRSSHVGSRSTTAVSASLTVAPANGGCWAHISKSTQP